MNTEHIKINNLKELSDGDSIRKVIMPEETKGVVIEQISLNGPFHFKGLPLSDNYDVLLFINGKGCLSNNNENKYCIENNYIAKMPYNKKYSIYVEESEQLQLLRFRKLLEAADIKLIKKNIEGHSKIYVRALDKCPTYTEDIKSINSTNRMLLAEGMVPRFCMGSVDSKGPDSVGEHSHPMLDQLFFGMKGCKCFCAADGDKAVLTENMMLHIPLGSKHSVSVEKGDTLSYIWLDFFLTLEGQKYMGRQHKVKESGND